MRGTGSSAGAWPPASTTPCVCPPARARLDADGTALVEAAATDMGPGTYTSQTQVAADALGLTVRTVTSASGTPSTRRPHRTATR
ncbi:MAG: molybdopterin cofactor-binding domain-containing protein [Streptomyces sp.]